MTGTVVNVAAVIAGGTLGTLLGERLPSRIRHIVMQGVGLVTLAVGMSMAITTKNFLLVLLSIVIGGILGSFQDGLSGDYTLLAIKSVLDGFSALAFAASMGMGATFSAITVLVYQGVLTLGASLFENTLTDAMITEMTATGGVMILGIGFLLLEIKRVRVANFLPALAIAPLLVVLWGKWGPR